MTGFLTLYAAQTAAAIRCSLADRANFALQIGGMAVNNVFFLSLWWLFFAGFRSVGGWTLPDMALLMGLTSSVVGLCGVFFGGYRDMAATILNGELDALLTQPKGLIGRLLARESIASGWGDLATGIVVISFFARLSWSQAALVPLAMAGGVTVYVAASLCFATLAFWAAGARSFARDLTDFTLLFSSYPGSIYTGAVKVIAFTVLPAAFVAMAPVRLIRAPGWEAAGMVVTSAAAYAALAAGLFHLGLRRYRRGASVAG